MIKRNLTKSILSISLALLIFGTGYRLGQNKSQNSSLSNINKGAFEQSKKAGQVGQNLDFDLFWETWTELENKFIDKKKLVPQKMFYGAIKGMVSSLEDPYTFFLTPEENKETKNDLAGKFEGIGAQLGLEEGRIAVIAPLKNSPALKAGIKSGDFINKVDDQSTRGWTLPQAVSKIRGPKGSQVNLTLERDAKEFEVNITRDQIRVDSIELSYEVSKNQNFAHLKVNQFGDNTNDEWDKAITEIKNKAQRGQVKGVILDLRDNPGGYLESSVYIASEFIPAGKLIVKQTSTIQDEKNYEAHRRGQLLDIPLVVLINKGSASASEIVAGALRDYKRAKLVGEKSFGKGSVQEAANLNSGAGLHVTVAKWILPKGDWINGKGIEPDIKVENKVEPGKTAGRETDSQLDKAIEILLQ